MQCKHRNTASMDRGPDEGIKESIKAPVAMTRSLDPSNILVLLDIREWFSSFAALSVMFPHSPNLNRKVWNRSHSLVSLFSFFFSLSRTSVSFLPHLFPVKGGGGCSREMMKFQGKVDVPSITGGGKVQINHLISPAFSPLSWGSSARGKSIKHHKWYMTQRSLSLYSGLCTYRTLALLSNNNSDQLPARWWGGLLCVRNANAENSKSLMKYTQIIVCQIWLWLLMFASIRANLIWLI